MKLNFIGEVLELLKGIEILSGEYGFELGEDGIPVRIEKTSGNIIVSLYNGIGNIGYSERVHFFRALGLFLENIREKDNFQLIECPQFSMNGAMFDASRNAVLKVESIKQLLRKMAVMGLNTVMMYTEDTYTLENKPYFGYMRGRYSFDELKECDDYAEIFGIEMIPCIQTLAHLTQALKWNYADDIKDTGDILLAGNEKTYEFIEEMIKAATAPFRSKRIHIGMDEAHSLGLGRYLDINGYHRRFDIMNEHLRRVLEIISHHGLDAMIWSDMYFRLASKTGWYYDWDAVIPEDVIEAAPKNVQLVYWDYYHKEEEFYRNFIMRHKRFGSNPVFAGGLWTWNGISISYGKAFTVTNAALNVCKEEGVKEVFATMWGDDGAETNLYSALLGLQLYAEHGYSSNLDMDKLRRRFKFCTGGEFESFMDLRYLDETPGAAEDNYYDFNPSKFLLWQDILIGLFDKHVEKIDLASHYDELEEKINKHKCNNKAWDFVFEVPEKLCSVLSLKSDIGIRIKKYYDMKDNKRLEIILNNELPELLMRVNDLRIAHRKQWLKVYKPFGWEVIDIRYGGLLARIDTAISRIKDYLNGSIDRIEELEEERLYFNGSHGADDMELCSVNQYSRIATASPL